jgi:Tol biopolymer transport system component
MTLSAGTHLGPYEILAPLGAGGMGEVFRARDTRLRRDVAIKLVRTDRVSSEDRLRRFEREARAAGGLDHPNILTVHDIGTHEGTPYLVTELLEGETLRDRLGAGGLTATRAVEYATQVARGLAAANAKGIVHRDLKPENLFVTRDGRVKILDFGLAKLSPSPDDVEPEGKTATAEPSTDTGARLGTVGYMSPEQVRGRAVDPRSDIFALGAVLYEMLSRQRPFRREGDFETLEAILHDDPPPLSRSDVPPALERIARRCLEKRPEDRFHSAHDLALALETCEEPARAARGHGRRWMAIAASATALVAVGAAWWLVRPGESRPTSPPGPLKFAPLTADGGWKDDPRLSPDGEKVAYVWSGADDDNWDIYVKAVGFGTRPLRLTRDPAPDTTPVWSPDGREIAFVRELEENPVLYVVPSMGGQERRLTEIVGPARPLASLFTVGSLSWSPDGASLVFAESGAQGGPARVTRFVLETRERKVLTSPPAGTSGDLCPELSPDGKQVAFVRGQESSGAGLQDVWVQPVHGGQARRLTTGAYGWACRLAWTPDGREIAFEAPPSSATGDTGTLLRVSAEGGDARPLLGPGQKGGSPYLRGSRLVYAQYDTPRRNIWRVPGRKAPPSAEMRKLASSSQWDGQPDYSPDGRRIAFISDRSGAQNIWVCASDGSNPAQVTSFEGNVAPGTPRWSPDGRRIVFDSTQSGSRDIWVVDAEGGIPQPLTREPSDENVGTWSRDGRSIYFSSDRSGRYEIWKIPVRGGPAVQVTRDGGFYAEESWDGRWLYYSAIRPAPIRRVSVKGGESTEVVAEPISWIQWTLSPSGIYFAVTRRRGRREEYTIRFRDFASGETTTVFRTEGTQRWGHNSPAVSPDGKWILVTAFPEWTSELVLVDGFR